MKRIIATAIVLALLTIGNCFAAEPVNINTADKAALDAIPGIGAVLAERIVAYRQENGEFKSVEELVDVKGLGPVSVEKIKELVSL